jgi:hypothetical protein
MCKGRRSNPVPATNMDSTKPLETTASVFVNPRPTAPYFLAYAVAPRKWRET